MLRTYHRPREPKRKGVCHLAAGHEPRTLNGTGIGLLFETLRSAG